MQSIDTIPQSVSRTLLGLLTDIDDTITSGRRLPAAAYSMLERLSEAGLLVIPITSRPAGCCGRAARFWPVDGIVGEISAFAFHYNHLTKQITRAFIASDEEPRKSRDRLAALARRIFAVVPGSAAAADQLYREADLAIDFCEDILPLQPQAVARILTLFTEASATAKASSIHVNGWFGTWDKLTTPGAQGFVENASQILSARENSTCATA